MSRAHPRLPHTSYQISRRVSDRCLRLIERKGKKVESLFRYAIAKAQRLTSVQVHAVVVMGNHWHCHLTDVKGNVPDFTATVHSLVARALNVEDNAVNGLWDNRKTNYLAIESAEDHWRYLVYLIVNPVAAILVKTHRDYPGFLTRPGQLARRTQAPRPRLRLFKRSRQRAIETLSLTIPPALSHLTPDQFRSELAFRVELEEELIRQRAARQGKTFLGARNIPRQNRHKPPQHRHARSSLRPTLAESDRQRRIERLTALAIWRDRYRKARLQWLAKKHAIFPPGTFKLRGLPGVEVAPPTDTS